MDLKSALVVLDEAQFPEFIREKVYSEARRANHLRQRFLRYLCRYCSVLYGISLSLRAGCESDEDLPKAFSRSTPFQRKEGTENAPQVEVCPC